MEIIAKEIAFSCRQSLRTQNAKKWGSFVLTNQLVKMSEIYLYNRDLNYFITAKNFLRFVLDS